MSTFEPLISHMSDSELLTMAKPDKFEVSLSNADRQLLRDIRDALRAIGVGEPTEEDVSTVKRLMEGVPRTVMLEDEGGVD